MQKKYIVRLTDAEQEILDSDPRPDMVRVCVPFRRSMLLPLLPPNTTVPLPPKVWLPLNSRNS